MSRNRKFTIFVYLIIGFAAIGLISQLLGNTVNFLSNLLIMLGIGVAIFGLLYFFVLRKRTPSNTDEMKKYRQAVKQSKTKYNKRPSTATAASPAKTTNIPKKRRNKRASHLRVIEGNKPKGKDRASY